MMHVPPLVNLSDALQTQPAVYIRQRKELAEIFGFETRNKYEIQDSGRRTIGFAAEQQKGMLGFLMRQFLGHWRIFDLMIFNSQRQQVMRAHHPFRFFFQRLEIFDAQENPMGAVQQRWYLFGKKFDLHDGTGRVIFSMTTPFWRIWTFPIVRGERQVALIQKKWAGLLKEAFTDSDNFRIQYEDPALTVTERALLLTATLFIDLNYFEYKSD